jgi:hypothetical protein
MQALVSEKKQPHPSVHPPERQEKLREEWEEAIQDYGRQSGEARTAKRRWEEGLWHYLRHSEDL